MPTIVTNTHDAWNRLVEVKYANEVRGEYEYNGLNWRIIKRVDIDADKRLDQKRIMYYLASCQLLGKRINDDASFTSEPEDPNVPQPGRCGP